MSVTAFPVLARILSERKMLNSELGAFALGCAAVDDLVAWSLLAIVVGVVQSSGVGDFVQMMLELAVFALALWFFARKILARVLALRKGNIDYAFIVLVVGVLVSAWVTDRIGLELIFGAFLFGTFIPKTESKAMVAEVVHRIESVTLIILLPVFFVVAGLAVNIRAIGWGGLGALLLIIAAAIVGKFGGAAAAAKSFGLPTRQSLALGVLMNTRGLTELVILTVGLSLGVLVPQLFTLFVIMAVVTTLLTGPGFRLTYPDVILQAEIDRARRIALQGGAYSPLVVIGEAMVAARAAIALGCRLARAPGQVIAVRFLAKVSSANVYSGIAGDLIAVTGAMEEVKEVAGDAVEPIVQLTADWREDLAAVVNRNVADVAVVTRGDLVDILEAGIALPCDMLGIDPPEVPGFGGLAVLVGGGAEGDAAIEVGLRISLGGIAQDRQGEAIALIPASRSAIARCHRVQHRVTASMPGCVTVRRDWLESPPAGTEAMALIVGTTPHSVGAPPELAARWSGPVWLVAASSGPNRPSLQERFRRLEALADVPEGGDPEVTKTVKESGR